MSRRQLIGRYLYGHKTLIVQSELKRERSVEGSQESRLHSVDVSQEERCSVWDAEQIN